MTAFIGRNGQGKTNLVEAIDYLSRLDLAPGRHRRAAGAGRRRAGRGPGRGRPRRPQAVLEVEINPGTANRARVNRRRLPRARELVGLVRTVVFAPEDLALVKGDPSGRGAGSSTTCWCCAPRGWPASAPTTTGCSSSATPCSRPPAPRAAGRSSQESALSTLGVWDAHLARTGAELLAERLRAGRGAAALRRQGLRDRGPRRRARDDAEARLPAVLRAARAALTDRADLDRRAARRARAAPQRRARPRRLPGRPAPRRAAAHPGQRRASRLPVQGYASHGESWSFALALRLASYDLLRADGDDPILILDDVFAELDTERRAQLAELVAGAEQVLVTAAVAADVPAALAGARFEVAGRRGHAVSRLTSRRADRRPSRRPDRRPGRAHDDDGLDLARALARATARSTPGRTQGRRAGPTAPRRAGRVSGAHPDDRDPQPSTPR